MKNFSGVGLGEDCVLGKKLVAGSAGSQKCLRIPSQITLRTKVYPPDYYDAAARDWGVYSPTKRITTARALQQCVDQEVYISRRFWLHLEYPVQIMKTARAR